VQPSHSEAIPGSVGFPRQASLVIQALLAVSLGAFIVGGFPPRFSPNGQMP
jgi:hypothetical protein